jgi:hypothetical protein
MIHLPSLLLGVLLAFAGYFIAVYAVGPWLQHLKERWDEI